MHRLWLLVLAAEWCQHRSRENPAAEQSDPDESHGGERRPGWVACNTPWTRNATDDAGTGNYGATLAGVADVAAHTQTESHHYVVHFPPHPARTSDPHYADFNAYHTKTRPTARCYVGERVGYGDCMDAQGKPCPPPDSGEQPGLELHHAHVEFSLQNGISLAALEVDYPGISDATTVGAWVETAANFRWLCAFHHRGAGGAHTAAHSDWEASQYVLGLITKG